VLLTATPLPPPVAVWLVANGKEVAENVGTSDGAETTTGRSPEQL